MKLSVTVRRHYVDDATKKLRSSFTNEVAQCLKVLLINRYGNQPTHLWHVKRAEFFGDKNEGHSDHLFGGCWGIGVIRITGKEEARGDYRTRRF